METAQAATSARVATENTQAPALLALIGELETKARVPLTAEQKAVATAKRNATRAARGITSKKVKKGVKGNVTAKLVVTPGTAPAPSAPVATPAPSAPAASAAANGGATPTTHG